MLNKTQIILLASALLVKDTLALNHHNHAHQHLHKKRDLKTEYETVVEWTTVTMWDDGKTETPTPKSFYKGNTRKEHYSPASKFAAVSTTSSSSTSTTSSSSSSSTSTSISIPAPAPVASTPPVPAPAPAVTHNVQAAVPEPSPSPVPAPAPAPVPEAAAPPAAEVSLGVTIGLGGGSSGSSGGAKRGLAYNDGGLVNLFSGSKASWTYNWGQTPDGGDKSGHEFVPMMWGPQHLSGWANNAEKAISNGAKNFLSFNECDNAGQANMDPGTAAAKHQEIMNPYAGRVRVSTPAITNSQDPNQGVGWLSQFLSACGGKCAYEFCAAHWYDQAQPSLFLNHLLKVHEVCQKPVWVTEFAPFGSDDQINDFLKEVMHQMDTNSTFGFVERYSYFMVSQGSLINGNGLSSFGHTFGFA